MFDPSIALGVMYQSPHGKSKGFFLVWSGKSNGMVGYVVQYGMIVTYRDYQMDGK